MRRASRAVANPEADPLASITAMDGLPEFAQPQLLAGIVAITLLCVAAGIEAAVIGLSLRRPAPARPLEPAVAEPVGHDFYDWLYE